MRKSTARILGGMVLAGLLAAPAQAHAECITVDALAEAARSLETAAVAACRDRGVSLDEAPGPALADCVRALEGEPAFGLTGAAAAAWRYDGDMASLCSGEGCRYALVLMHKLPGGDVLMLEHARFAPGPDTGMAPRTGMLGVLRAEDRRAPPDVILSGADERLPAGLDTAAERALCDLVEAARS